MTFITTPPAGGIKRAINFDGTGIPPIIQYSRGILSLVDLGEGAYNLFFLNDEPDRFYVFTGAAGQNLSPAARIVSPNSATVSSVGVRVFSGTTPDDTDCVNVLISR